MQDATKVLMGAVGSSAREITKFGSDPASFPAGKAVSLASEDTLSLLASSGLRVGISLGRSLSDHKKTAVCRIGESVPVLLGLKKARGTVTITSFANLLTTTPDVITINGQAFTAQSGAATPGAAVFQAATSNNATAASLAAQINAHATIGALVRAKASSAVVTLAAVAGGSAGNLITTTYADNGGGNIGATVQQAVLASGSDLVTDSAWPVIGAKAYIDDITGEFVDGSLPGCTISDATYISGVLTGINEDSSNVPAAKVDITGGL